MSKFEALFLVGLVLAVAGVALVGQAEAARWDPVDGSAVGATDPSTLGLYQVGGLILVVGGMAALVWSSWRWWAEGGTNELGRPRSRSLP